MRPLFGHLVFIFMFFFNYIKISSGMYSRGQNEREMPVDENGLVNFPGDLTGHSENDYPPGHSMQTHYVLPSGSPNFHQNHQNFYNNELQPIHHETHVSTNIPYPQNFNHNYQHNTSQGRTRSSSDWSLLHTTHATSVSGSSTTRQNRQENRQRNTSPEPIRDKYDLYVQIKGGRTNDPATDKPKSVYERFAQDLPNRVERFKSSGSDKHN